MSRFIEIVLFALVALMLVVLAFKFQQEFDFSSKCEEFGGVAVQKLRGGRACVADDALLRGVK